MLGLGAIFTIFFITLGPLKLLGPFAQQTRSLDIAKLRGIAFRAFGIGVIAVGCGRIYRFRAGSQVEHLGAGHRDGHRSHFPPGCAQSGDGALQSGARRLRAATRAADGSDAEAYISTHCDALRHSGADCGICCPRLLRKIGADLSVTCPRHGLKPVGDAVCPPNHAWTGAVNPAGAGRGIGVLRVGLAVQIIIRALRELQVIAS
jgi:hypothetical protein